MPAVRSRTEVVVIGAGQAGLAVAYFLQKLGLAPGTDFEVLDRGPGTGGAWQHRWDALRVGSAHRINDLPGMDALGLSFDDADRSLPAREVVADYYDRYERHFGLAVHRSVDVTAVENDGADLAVRFREGDASTGSSPNPSGPPRTTQVIRTDIVVNATGTWGSPFVPWYPGREGFLGTHLHTADYSAAADFAGQHVIVVGGGTSAVGFLLELEHVASGTTWVTRTPPQFLGEGELDLEARVAAVAMQDGAAREGRALPSIVSGTGLPKTRRIAAGIDRGVLVARPMFSAIEPHGVRWADGSFQRADVIIWATGFRPELRHLAPLKLREPSGGVQVGNGSAWRDGRIFFAGYGPAASTIGANRAGRTIARHVVAALSKR